MPLFYGEEAYLLYVEPVYLGAEGATPEDLEGEEIGRVLSILGAALERYHTLQGEGRFAEAGAELERIYDLMESLSAGD